jgi:hypothetical protein
MHIRDLRVYVLETAAFGLRVNPHVWGAGVTLAASLPRLQG